MPRPMLKPAEKNRTSEQNILSATYQPQKQTQNTAEQKMLTDRLLRRKRSKSYMEAMRKLDAGGHVQNQGQTQEIIDALRKEFPEVELSGILLGCVAVCYLGKPYEVHTVDMTAGIIKHYKAGESLPDGMEKARNIAMRGGYEFIEVYVDCCRAVNSLGMVSVIR